MPASSAGSFAWRMAAWEGWIATSGSALIAMTSHPCPPPRRERDVPCALLSSRPKSRDQGVRSARWMLEQVRHDRTKRKPKGRWILDCPAAMTHFGRVAGSWRWGVSLC